MENFASISNRYKLMVEEHLKRLPLSDPLRKNWNILTKVVGNTASTENDDDSTVKANVASGGSVALAVVPTAAANDQKTGRAPEGGGMKGHDDSKDQSTSTSSSLNASFTDNAPPS